MEKNESLKKPSGVKLCVNLVGFGSLPGGAFHNQSMNETFEKSDMVSLILDQMEDDKKSEAILKKDFLETKPLFPFGELDPSLADHKIATEIAEFDTFPSYSSRIRTAIQLMRDKNIYILILSSVFHFTKGVAGQHRNGPWLVTSQEAVPIPSGPPSEIPVNDHRKSIQPE
jgi:hypothetical protein